MSSKFLFVKVFITVIILGFIYQLFIYADGVIGQELLVNLKIWVISFIKNKTHEIIKSIFQ